MYVVYVLVVYTCKYTCVTVTCFHYYYSTQKILKNYLLYLGITFKMYNISQCTEFKFYVSRKYTCRLECISHVVMKSYFLSSRLLSENHPGEVHKTVDTLSSSLTSVYDAHRITVVSFYSEVHVFRLWHHTTK